MRKTNVLFLLMLFLTTTSAWGQSILSGKVLSAQNNEPIIGASIIVKDAKQGSISDVNGEFSLTVPQGSKTLTASCIGYHAQEIDIVGKSTVTILLQEDDVFLDEVVVIGYGTAKKSDLTGAVTRANVKDFEKSANTNIVQLLQGTVPGLNVSQVASAGATPDLSIRGKNTISGNTGVLIVLDGIIYTGSLSSINPADIESVDILKDASATAVYGAQAANGVMLLTSKKGKKGAAKISFSSSYSLQTPTKNLDVLNRQQMIDWATEVLWAEAYTAESGYTQTNPTFNLVAKMPDAYMTTEDGQIVDSDFNWFKEFTRTGHINENKLTVSGGSNEMNYLISLGNVTQKNYLLNDDFKRNSIRVNVSAKPRKWLEVGVQAFGSFVNTDGQETYLPYLIQMSPLASPYDADGKMIDYPMRTAVETPYHGSMVDDRDRRNNFFGNLYSEIQLPIKGLKYRINYGNNYVVNEHFYASKFAENNNGSAYKTHSSNYDYTLDNILNYLNTFGKHEVGATFVYGASSRNYFYTNAESKLFSRITLGYNSLEQGTNQFTNSDAWEENLLYQMFRFNYKFDEKYLLTATVRRDGYSGFAANNKSAIFPSAALGWTMSEESWFNVSAIDLLKWRVGYGVSGNQTNRYSSLARVASETGYIFGDGASGVLRQELSSMQNSDLKWEKTKGLNAGLDFSLLKQRLFGSVEYYNTKTNDLLYAVAIPSITGFKSILSNVGCISNQGIELNITSRNIVRKYFTWETTFNISHNKNKIVELTGQDKDGDGKEDDLVASGLFIGESLSAIYDYQIDGIWQVGDDIPSGFYPGTFRIKDTDGVDGITPDDRTIIGNTDPFLRMGLLNNLRYKNITLSVFINSAVGGKDGYLGQNSHNVVRNDNAIRYNHLKEEADLFWSPNNPDGIYARSQSTAAIEGLRYEKRDFLRLQDVTLGYDLPKTLVNTLQIENINVYLNAKNLLTLTGWHGWDPEASFSKNTTAGISRVTGSGYDNRPVMKSVTLGINIMF